MAIAEGVLGNAWSESSIKENGTAIVGHLRHLPIYHLLVTKGLQRVGPVRIKRGAGVANATALQVYENLFGR
jgi:hypothetical protein